MPHSWSAPSTSALAYQYPPPPAPGAYDGNYTRDKNHDNPRDQYEQMHAAKQLQQPPAGNFNSVITSFQLQHRHPPTPAGYPPTAMRAPPPPHHSAIPSSHHSHGHDCYSPPDYSYYSPTCALPPPPPHQLQQYPQQHYGYGIDVHWDQPTAVERNARKIQTATIVDLHLSGCQNRKVRESMGARACVCVCLRATRIMCVCARPPTMTANDRAR